MFNINCYTEICAIYSIHLLLVSNLTKEWFSTSQFLEFSKIGRINCSNSSTSLSTKCSDRNWKPKCRKQRERYSTYNLQVINSAIC